MAERNGVGQIYADFCRFIGETEKNGFATYFQQAVRTSPTSFSIFEKYVERRVDMQWVEMMEKAIVPLDNIIRKPNSFIKREEDIIPIAQARNIGPESVRHLAQHTSMISSVKKGKVTPARILNITKDDSLETYENRFIYTLIRQTSYFLDKRMRVLMKDSRVADQFTYHVDGNCGVGTDKFTYNLDMRLESPHEELDEDALIDADVTKMTPMQRIERLRKIFYTFQSSAFFRNIMGAADVRPPLVMTNVLRKNPNFIQAVALWNFINSYTKPGYSTEDVEEFRDPTETDKVEFYALVMLQYAIAKKHGELSEEGRNEEQEEKPIGEGMMPVNPPNIVRNAIDNLCDNYDLSVDEVRRIYEKELRKKDKKRNAEFTKARGIFERALDLERDADRLAEIVRHSSMLAELRQRFALACFDEEDILATKPKTPIVQVKDLDAVDLDRTFAYQYRFSFAARLVQGGDPLQSYYTEIRNYLCSFKKVKNHMSWGFERYSIGRAPIAKVRGRGKCLTLLLCLPETAFLETKYHLKDLRTPGEEVDYNAQFRVTSPRALKYAKELIAMRMTQLNAPQGELPTDDFHFDYMPTEELLYTDPPLVKRVENANPAAPAKKPMPKPQPKAVQQPAEVQNPELDEAEEGRGFAYQYRFSFAARLVQSGDPLQSYYTELRNYLSSFKKVKSHMAWSYDRYAYGRKPIAKLRGRGKNLTVILCVPATAFLETKYHLQDLRVPGEDVDYNAQFRVTSLRALKYAKELIAMRMAELNVPQGEIPTDDFHFDYMPTEMLLSTEPPLVKKVKAKPQTDRPDAEKATEMTDENEADSDVCADFEGDFAEKSALSADLDGTLPEKEETPVTESTPAQTAAKAEPERDISRYKNNIVTLFADLIDKNFTFEDDDEPEESEG